MIDPFLPRHLKLQSRPGDDCISVIPSPHFSLIAHLLRELYRLSLAAFLESSRPRLVI